MNTMLWIKFQQLVWYGTRVEFVLKYVLFQDGDVGRPRPISTEFATSKAKSQFATSPLECLHCYPVQDQTLDFCIMFNAQWSTNPFLHWHTTHSIALCIAKILGALFWCKDRKKNLSLKFVTFMSMKRQCLIMNYKICIGKK